jgi:hypothetical protein
MATFRFGPARVASGESPDEAVRPLRKRDFDACEIDWLAGEFGEECRTNRLM